MAKTKSGKKSLKDALLNHQRRLQKNKQAKEAVQRQQDKTSAHNANSKKSKGKAKEINSSRKSTIPFSTTDTILLIGEGNFSFALSLLKHPALPYLPPKNVTATAYDSEEECYEKYPDAKDIVTQLREKGVEVLFKVDATALEKIKVFRARRWDRIVWNFPHAGSGITDQDRNILANQKLLLGFLRSAASFLTSGPPPFLSGGRKKRKRPGSDDEDEDNLSDEDDIDVSMSNQRSRGTILMTLRNVHPYIDWDLPNLAKRPPLPTSPSASTTLNPQYTQLRSFVFHRADWPGYEHRMTKGERAHGAGTTGVGGEDRTWEFYLKDQ